MKDGTGSLLVICIIILAQKFHTTYAFIYATTNQNETQEFNDMIARFGPGIPSTGITDALAPGDPYNGCSKMKKPPLMPGSNTSFAQFALISRGDCDFAVKVFNAQNAGYSAVIIHSTDSDVLVPMGTGKPEIANKIYIPSVYVGLETARILNTTYLYNDKGSPDIQLYEDINPLEYYLWPFVAVIGVCFFSILFFLLIKCIRERRRARRGRLSLQRLKKLPVKKFDKGDEYDVCAICLEDYEEGESLRILPCRHAYHCKCVDPWLTSSKRICPLCKRRVLSDDESSSSSDDPGDSSDDENTPLVPASDAASPNAPRYGTGFGVRNPFSNWRIFARRASVSSDGTTSTDVSVTESFPQSSSTRDRTRSRFLANDLPETSGYQSQHLSTASTSNPEVGRILPSGTTSQTDADTYLNSAEDMMTRNNRVSESSIAVLSDVETGESSPEPVSYSTNFYSVDETDATTPHSLDAQADRASDSNQEDIIVIAGTSVSRAQGGNEV